MTHRPRDMAERLLGMATKGLPSNRSQWGAAMRADLASIDDPESRWRFARSAAGVGLRQGNGIRIGFALLAGALVAVVSVTASRIQMSEAGPGLLTVTVPLPALMLLVLALISARLTRSFRFGMETGMLSLLVGFAALFVVLAVEGQVWMERAGVFILDGDPPQGAVRTSEVVFDLFTTGMWVGHVIVWTVAVMIGTALGALLGQRAPASTGCLSS